MGQYSDIIDYKYDGSKKRHPMSLHDRAAQFSPFAALTGFEEETKEARRLTEDKVILDESQKEYIGQQLQLAVESPEMKVEITYYMPDARKDGGSYQEIQGKIKKLDGVENCVVMENGSRIFFDMIIEVQCI